MSRWSQRWRETLATDATAERRLAQGHAWDRSGRVTQVRLSDGLLQGRVQGSAATPFAVSARVGQFDDSDWARVYDVLKSQVRHHAHLLAGQAPDGLEDQLADQGLDLLPTTAELDTDCPCGDSVWPCVHVAAVWEAAGSRLQSDPFMVFQLRGRGRQQLMADLADQRRGTQAPSGVALTDLPTSGWAAPRAPIEDVALPAVERPASPHPLLRLLGDPPGWEGRLSAWEMFAPLVATASGRHDGPEEDDRRA